MQRVKMEYMVTRAILVALIRLFPYLMRNYGKVCSVLLLRIQCSALIKCHFPTVTCKRIAIPMKNIRLLGGKKKLQSIFKIVTCVETLLFPFFFPIWQFSVIPKTYIPLQLLIDLWINLDILILDAKIYCITDRHV